MAKRRAADPLTGGTRDVNPQTLGGRVTESAANTFTQQQIAVPVNRVTSSLNTAQVIEALWIEFETRVLGTIQAVADELEVQLTQTSKTTSVNIDDVDMIAKIHLGIVMIATTGGNAMNQVFHINLTDGAGHGPIIAVPNVFLGIEGTSLSAAQGASFRMGYRFKNVGLQEYVGLAIQFGQA